MNFVDLLDSVEKKADHWRAEIPSTWMQGRTAYGGLTGALALRVLRQELGVEEPLLTADIGFVAPVEGEVLIEARLLRKGRSVTHAEATLRAETGEVVTRVYAVFGAQRESSIIVTPPPPAPTKPREEGMVIPEIPGITPTFLQHFELIHTEGALPYTGATEGTLGGYFRHRGAPKMNDEAVLALADAWPPAILTMGKGPFAGSTVRWSCHFVGPIPEDYDGYWWYRAETIAAAGGYGTTRAVLYAGDEMVCWSEQLVAVFEK